MRYTGPMTLYQTNKKNLDWSKLRASADYSINMICFVNGTVENILGKGENAGYQYFLLFPQYFQKGFFPSVFKSLHCAVRVKSHRLQCNCRAPALKIKV